LLRENGDSAPGQTIGIDVRADKGSAKAPSTLLFEAGSATEPLKIDYSNDALAPNAADIITVKADEVSHRVTIRRSAGEKSAATYTRQLYPYARQRNHSRRHLYRRRPRHQPPHIARRRHTLRARR